MDNILSLLHFELPFVLETDASDESIGAALMQRVEGKDCPSHRPAFYSRAMISPKKNTILTKKTFSDHLISGTFQTVPIWIKNCDP